ncbi:hypothetical protein COO91_10667 (plasmid) [Nostoc flagelliforme CCNUN1]|uniref:Uncharacterized protein n=1 Tax=Nostoc flagelliforme CCNUN1 TaxID=2038116 RepID=A0A2K8T9S4_9NOSO|nr:hypothetical protein [Nostoc flagelliforme]AUB44444.1 hypothetical protein COO91_10667 [Nostoc flagelliforme CCNUN1]
MDIQSTLTQAIEVIVMSFVALMIFDFIDGLYVVPLPPIAIAQSNASSKSTVTATQFEPLPKPEQPEVEPQQIPFVTSRFEEIPDPWTLEADSYNSNISTQAVILPFPTLRLLPPVKQQSRTTKNTKNTKKSQTGVHNKSGDLALVGLKVLRKPGRPRKAS